MKQVMFCLATLFALLSACQPAEILTPSARPSQTDTPAMPAAVLPLSSPSPTAFPATVPQAGATMLWLDGSVLVYVPAGEFVMGDGAADALPHLVYLSAYWIQQSEVTNAMYAACVRAGVCGGLPNLIVAGAESLPVTGVTWAQARNYCDWIQGRLPTEAEWERAAQGPGSAAYPWGDEIPDCEHANFGLCRRTLNPVGSLRKGNSPLGLFDMAGNAAEWVSDWYDPNYYRDAPAEDPVGPAFSDVRAVRGGSYASTAAQVSAYARSYEWPRRSRSDLGFRCVVPTPILYPPYCQVAAFLSSAPSALEADACQPPVTKMRGSYCQQKKGYVSVDMPAGARWRLETPRFDCIVTAVSTSIDRLTCYGQGNLDLQVTICSPECFGGQADTSVICAAGYALDAASGLCVYRLFPAGACPPDFVSLTLDGKSLCLPPAVGQMCPAGQYLDTSLGGCLPGGGQTACLIYGQENAETARRCYQGCPTGYTYDAAAQCCRSRSSGYPECPAGYVYDEASRACLSGAGFVSAGCVTLTLRTGACVDCGVYPNCVPGCKPDKKTQTCIMP